MEVETAISENTSIKLGLVLGLLATLIGGVVFVTKIYFVSNENKIAIQRITEDIEAVKDDINPILREITEVQSKLDFLIDSFALSYTQK